MNQRQLTSFFFVLLLLNSQVSCQISLDGLQSTASETISGKISTVEDNLPTFYSIEQKEEDVGYSLPTSFRQFNYIKGEQINLKFTKRTSETQENYYWSVESIIKTPNSIPNPSVFMALELGKNQTLECQDLNPLDKDISQLFTESLMESSFDPSQAGVLGYYFFQRIGGVVLEDQIQSLEDQLDDFQENGLNDIKEWADEQTTEIENNFIIDDWENGQRDELLDALKHAASGMKNMQDENQESIENGVNDIQDGDIDQLMNDVDSMIQEMGSTIDGVMDSMPDSSARTAIRNFELGSSSQIQDAVGGVSSQAKNLTQSQADNIDNLAEMDETEIEQAIDELFDTYLPTDGVQMQEKIIEYKSDALDTLDQVTDFAYDTLDKIEPQIMIEQYLGFSGGQQLEYSLLFDIYTSDPQGPSISDQTYSNIDDFLSAQTSSEITIDSQILESSHTYHIVAYAEDTEQNLVAVQHFFFTVVEEEQFRPRTVYRSSSFAEQITLDSQCVRCQAEQTLDWTSYFQVMRDQGSLIKQTVEIAPIYGIESNNECLKGKFPFYLQEDIPLDQTSKTFTIEDSDSSNLIYYYAKITFKYSKTIETQDPNYISAEDTLFNDKYTETQPNLNAEFYEEVFYKLITILKDPQKCPKSQQSRRILQSQENLLLDLISQSGQLVNSQQQQPMEYQLSSDETFSMDNLDDMLKKIRQPSVLSKTLQNNVIKNYLDLCEQHDNSIPFNLYTKFNQNFLLGNFYGAGKFDYRLDGCGINYDCTLHGDCMETTNNRFECQCNANWFGKYCSLDQTEFQALNKQRTEMLSQFGKILGITNDGSITKIDNPKEATVFLNQIAQDPNLSLEDVGSIVGYLALLVSGENKFVDVSQIQMIGQTVGTISQQLATGTLTKQELRELIKAQKINEVKEKYLKKITEFLSENGQDKLQINEGQTQTLVIQFSDQVRMDAVIVDPVTGQEFSGPSLEFEQIEATQFVQVSVTPCVATPVEGCDNQIVIEINARGANGEQLEIKNALINIKLKRKKNGKIPQCSFYDETTGTLSSEGVSTVSSNDSDDVTCITTHLTSFTTVDAPDVESTATTGQQQSEDNGATLIGVFFAILIMIL